VIGALSVRGILGSVIEFYTLLVFAYVILSWFPSRSGIFFDVYHVLAQVCEPYLGLFRRIMPSTGGIDFSPLVAILVLQYVLSPVIFAILGMAGL